MEDMGKMERYKQLVDKMFDKINDGLSEAEAKFKDHKIVTPQAVRKRLDEKKLEIEQNKEIVPEAMQSPQDDVIELALEELEIVREAFLEFQEQISDLAMYQFIYPEIEEFVEFCLDLVELVEDDFDVENLQGKSLEQYQKIQKLRARILSAIYMKYKKKEEES